MSFDDYRSAEGLNASTIKNFVVSARHGVEAMGDNSPPSAVMRLGTAVHARCEVGDDFDRYAVEVEGIKPGSQRETWVKKSTDLETDQIPLAEGQRIVVEKIHDAMMAHPVAGKQLRKPHESELSVFWDDPDLKVPGKARFDRWLTRTGCVLDIKTTESTQPKKIRSKVSDYGYHIQAAWYLRAARYGLGCETPEFLFVFVESTPPHDVVIAPLAPEAIEQGWAECCEAAMKRKRWRDTGEAVGVSDTPMTIELPTWAQIRGMAAPYELLGGSNE